MSIVMYCCLHRVTPSIQMGNATSCTTTNQQIPVGVYERTSMKEHLASHGSKHKIQVYTTKRKSYGFQKKKKKRETRERKQKLEEKIKIDGYSKHTCGEETLLLKYIGLPIPFFFSPNLSLTLVRLLVKWSL